MAVRDEHKSRALSRSSLERRELEAAVAPHLPKLAELQARVARLRAETSHSLRIGETPTRLLPKAKEALRAIERVRKALGVADRQPQSRVADVERSLGKLAQQLRDVQHLAEGKQPPHDSAVQRVES